jgi:1-acyl-sn-glycerol-3-phosphate acyltransferase
MLFYRLRRTGLENIPAEGAVVIVSNHQSHFDPPFVGGGSPRRMNYLARESLFKFGPFGWVSRSLDAIPIDLEGVGLSGIKETLRRLKRGEMVLVFPEGGRTHDGEIQPFLPGFVALARRTRASIVPAAVEGAYDVWPRTRKFPKLWGRIHVLYGKPMTPEEISQYDEEELIAELERRVRACRDILQARPVFSRNRDAAEQCPTDG